MCNLRVLAFPGARRLAEQVAARLGVRVETLSVTRFPNEQREVLLPPNNATGGEIVLLQVFPDDVHGRLMELLLGVDAAAQARPRRLTAVLPYLPYARSDRPPQLGAPVGIRLLARLLEQAGVNRLVTLTLHTPQVAAAFSCPVIELDAMPSLVAGLASAGPDAGVVVSPDLGGAKRAQAVADALSLPLAAIRKRRYGDRKLAIELIGEVAGRRALIIDDEINSGETLLAACRLLRSLGSTGVDAATVHALFTPAAEAVLATSDLDRLAVTDSVGGRAPALDKIVTVPVAGLLANALTSR